MTPNYRQFCSQLIEVLEQYAPLHEDDAALVSRVRACIQAETLLEAVGMEKELCNPLKLNGYTSVEQVLEADPKDLMECKGLGPDRVGRILAAIRKYQKPMMTNRLTREQVDAFLARHKDLSEARRFLQELGLIDASGELTKEYRPYPMDDLREVSADVSGVELDDCWWQKAARERVEQKAEAILDAYCTLADLRNREVSNSEMLAAALRETINQCQNSQGMIPAPELLRIARELDYSAMPLNFILEQ